MINSEKSVTNPTRNLRIATAAIGGNTQLLGGSHFWLGFSLINAVWQKFTTMHHHETLNEL